MIIPIREANRTIGHHETFRLAPRAHSTGPCFNFCSGRTSLYLSHMLMIEICIIQRSPYSWFTQLKSKHLVVDTCLCWWNLTGVIWIQIRNRPLIFHPLFRLFAAAWRVLFARHTLASGRARVFLAMLRELTSLLRENLNLRHLVIVRALCFAHFGEVVFGASNVMLIWHWIHRRPVVKNVQNREL